MEDRDKNTAPETRILRLEAQLERERKARQEAEQLLESKSIALYEANTALSRLANSLEQQVDARTRQLSVERSRALQLAESDALTGLANRASFLRQLADGLANAQATMKGFAVLLIDLDRFKTVNDTLGHAAGDNLLIEFARRLGDAVRPGDLVARLGGDEFAVIAYAIGRRERALGIAHRLLNVVCRPALIEGRGIPCSCSIGVAQAVGPGIDPDALLRDADLALYASKRAGRGRATLFESSLRTDIDRRLESDAAVRQAITDDCIQPWYQTITNLQQASSTSAELLARWHLPDGTVRAAAEFLETVEALGLLDTMMENLLQRALREVLPLILDGSLDYLAINVSPSQFNQGWVLNRLPVLLKEAHFPPTGLVVEITETALLRDLDTTRAVLSALADIGIRIALDDFGVGYSNFSLLRQLKFDLLKLDRTLICDIESDRHARSLVEGLIKLLAQLDIQIIAEGVETQTQTKILAAAGCTMMQGYWFSRPQRHLRSH